jgi:hypothetical protein
MALFKLPSGALYYYLVARQGAVAISIKYILFSSMLPLYTYNLHNVF